MFNTVLIANRGAIATRIIRTLKKLGIRSVAVYHQADKDSLHVQQADEAVCLGEGSVAETYLNIETILNIAKQQNVDAIHPGYGFLSENTDFVSACEAQGIVFIGPTSEQINLFGLKHLARDAAENAGVPLVPGSPLLQQLDEALSWAQRIGYPVMMKSTAGGGGIGMQACMNEEDIVQGWESVKRLGASYFSNDGVFLEKLVSRARHIEVQVFGDGQGTAISFGERDCSAQRRNQKVVEETPAFGISDDTRSRLHKTAETLMASVRYRNAGTVEFIYDVDAEEFYFLEVNTRLQVEHGVTEQIWNVDLVELMVQQASGELGSLVDIKSSLSATGHSMQARIYAENPAQNFMPSSGLLSEVRWPEGEGVRIDSWVDSGIEVPELFDPMVAKVIVHSEDRDSAIEKLATVLKESSLYGIQTNKEYVQGILKGPMANGGQLLTSSLSEFQVAVSGFSVLAGGTQTTIQDYPGRQNLWDVGVPPSGAMDNLSLRLANQLVNNDEDAAGLEITLNGPKLQFHSDCDIAVVGADFSIEVDGARHDVNRVIRLRAGQILNIGKVKAAGARCYLAIKGGIQCPDYLGSKSTFTLGQFGGHNGRALRTGDVISLSDSSLLSESEWQKVNTQDLRGINALANQDITLLRVIYGPHGAPDFFTGDDIQKFFAHTWEVHYNSSRTGVRLIGPKPEWARLSGGEAGMHPSNIHDNAYAFGTVDFTGDMPVILGPDGPSLGGFVCPATVISADLWKLGQLKAGSKIRFQPVSYGQAVEYQSLQKEYLQSGMYSALADVSAMEAADYQAMPITNLISPIVHTAIAGSDDVVCRLAGDNFLLVEFGPLELDIARRFKVHALMLWLQKKNIPGLLELTPGIRSLQIHYDSLRLSLSQITQLLDEACGYLANAEDLTVPSRTVYLPLSWDDEACQLAIEKYTQSVRADAPWCPSNLEFIRRINGLKDIQAVKDIVFDANYLVMGLGDVYLGAPVATPLDPRHRLVTTKYNPARTWTAENSVGIGGAYMCVYGMEGPGGYQFIGRTSQMWNRYHQTKDFQKPWLLRFFDQIKFYEVSADELKDIRAAVPKGEFNLRIEESSFNLSEYQSFLNDNQSSITGFIEDRDQAFDAELARWKRDGQFTYEAEEIDAGNSDSYQLEDDSLGVDSPVSGSVWQCLIEEGQTVKEGQVLMVLESMKMEIEILAPADGVIQKVLKQQGQSVQSGQVLAVFA